MYTPGWLVDGGPLAAARHIGKLQDEVNRVFGAHMGGVPAGFPPVNMWVREDEAVVEAEVPGVEMKDIEVAVTGDSLSITGERKKDEAGAGKAYHRTERRFGAFSRVVELPFRVEAAKVSANARNGVLRIVLPRSEQDKPRKISVAAE